MFKSRSSWCIGGLLIGLLVGGFLGNRILGHALTSVADPVGRFLREFALSPGAAGLAAVVAAGLAWYTGHRDRQAHDQEIQAGVWWERLQWALDASSEANERERVLAIQMLYLLANRDSVTDEDKEFVEMAYELVVQSAENFEFTEETDFVEQFEQELGSPQDAGGES